MTQVKICGLKDPDLVAFAAREGADWIGFMFPVSPRQVTLAAAETLLLSVGKAVPVAVLLDPPDEEVRAVAALGFPVLQLHGQETPERVGQIKAMTGAEVWKVLGIRSAEDLAQAGDYGAADRLLLDAKPPEGDAQKGGHGAAFDWSLLKGWTAPKPWILAGGLTPENVADAIGQTAAPAVDVSSGVETAPGVKDAARIAAFLKAVA
jgi:phosphoribosylanthranilate isomerase